MTIRSKPRSLATSAIWAAASPTTNNLGAFMHGELSGKVGFELGASDAFGPLQPQAGAAPAARIRTQEIQKAPERKGELPWPEHSCRSLDEGGHGGAGRREIHREQNVLYRRHVFGPHDQVDDAIATLVLALHSCDLLKKSCDFRTSR